MKLTKNARHGDFCRGNVLIDNNGRVRITDWEFYLEDSEPIFDIMFYIISAHVEVDPGAAFTRRALLERGRYSRVARYLISEFARAKGLPEELLVQAVPYVLARCLYRATSDKEDNRHLDAALYLRLLESWTSA
jgi:aminoglycoside phosphotransferase (APT) family kinase protein